MAYFIDPAETHEVPFGDTALVVGWAPRAKVQVIGLEHDRASQAAMRRLQARVAAGEATLLEVPTAVLEDPDLAKLTPEDRAMRLHQWPQNVAILDDPEYREHMFLYARDLVRWTVREAVGGPALATEEVAYQGRKYRALTIEAADLVRDSCPDFFSMLDLCRALFASQSVTEAEKKRSSRSASASPPPPPTGAGSASTAPPTSGEPSSSGATGSA